MMSEFKEKIEEMVADHGRDLMCEENPWDDYDYTHKTGSHTTGWEDGVTLEVVDSYGGEDQGSNYYAVWKFAKGEESYLVKFYGWYASHYGSEYEGYEFVKPKQKTITVYVSE